VSGGSIRFDLPVGYDYTTETAIFGVQDLSLAPDGREIMSELNWTGRIGVGPRSVGASTSVYYRREPGHFADAPADLGALLSVSAAF